MAADVEHGCWVKGVTYSHFFLCCAQQEHWRSSEVTLPDCWVNGWAHGSREPCCQPERMAKLDAKVSQLAYGIANVPSPCERAGPLITNYIADAADRSLVKISG